MSNVSSAIFIEQMPKVELHVHLEGTITAETLLRLGMQHNVPLPAQTVEGLVKEYTFTDFNHFMILFRLAKNCIRTVEDIELIAREFFSQQARQNIIYSEVTYTAYTHFLDNKLNFTDQLAALNRARMWAEAELGITAGWILDIPRRFDADVGHTVTEWAISAMDKGVVALGLGGVEVGNPPTRFATSFDLAEQAGLSRTLHAGETVGAESVRDALDVGRANRIGHGIRCLEDHAVVQDLYDRQIPLEVCPSSNVCLLPEIQFFSDHPLPRLLDAGLTITINSDDPPFFNTTLTEELLRCVNVFALSIGDVEELTINAARAAFLPQERRSVLEQRIRTECADLRCFTHN